MTRESPKRSGGRWRAMRRTGAKRAGAFDVAPTIDYRRVIRLTSMAVAFLGAMWIALAIPTAGLLTAPGGDSHAYWAARLPTPYGGTLGSGDAFLYTPVAALFLAPFTLLSWPTFHILYAVVTACALLWLARGWALPLLFFPPVTFELWSPNIHLLLAVAIVLGFRYPGAWAFVLLTKVSPGVGLLWFAVRREWRSLAVALGVTGGLVLASVVVFPALWAAWIEVISASTAVELGPLTVTMVPLSVRLPVSAAIVTFAALTNRRWLIPVACTIALPVLWIHGAAMLVGVIPLLSAREGVRGPSMLRPVLSTSRS